MKKGDAKQQSVLITGATDGLGKVLALLLADRGYRVFAAGRSPQKLAELDAIAREKKLPLQSITLDVCSDDSVQRAVSDVLAKAAAIDVLVNNAGVNYTAAVEDLTMDAWRAQFETNFFGVLRVTRSVLPHMRERRSGRILMMSSLSGLVTPPTQGAYRYLFLRLDAEGLEAVLEGWIAPLVRPEAIVNCIGAVKQCI